MAGKGITRHAKERLRFDFPVHTPDPPMVLPILADTTRTCNYGMQLKLPEISPAGRRASPQLGWVAGWQALSAHTPHLLCSLCIGPRPSSVLLLSLSLAVPLQTQEFPP